MSGLRLLSSSVEVEVPLSPLAVGLALLAWPPAALPDTSDADRRTAVLRAEDRRPTTAEGLRPLLDGLRSPDSVTRALAARALGRLERPALLDDLAPALADPAAGVRVEAANAVGQSVFRGTPDDGARAARLLEARLGLEADPEARGALLRTLGRLPRSPDQSPDPVERLLVLGTRGPADEAPTPAVLGAAHGLFSLYRRAAARHPPSVEALERLVELVSRHPSPLVRRVAMAAFVASGRTDSGALLAALDDPVPEVRRLAAAAAGLQAELPGRERLLRRALADGAPAVRYEALRAWGRRALARMGCEPVYAALADPDAHVRLLAVELLAGCGPGAVATLHRIAAAPADPDAWHLPARALEALARLDPAAADPLLAAAAAHPLWWVRMHAARAGGQARAADVLERLARDPAPNVREAALDALRPLRGHAADPLYREALALSDYQLVRTAALALDSTPDPARAVPVLLDALRRLTAERRETSRDARAALLTALGTAGGAAQAGALRPLLRDFDPAIARQAAGILTRWTGTPHAPDPRPLHAPPAPSWEEIERLEAVRPVLVMRGGGRVALRLLPRLAPTNAARFVRLARSGWFDGLTFHRVVANFVVQGGSPGANEYAGDGPYTRDELGLASHLRGTVGLSTRGRDTGDGQIFVNLVDNLRLDHDYTVFAEVVEGMEVVDRMLEGAVIERVELGGAR